jgi:hypothetical protein
MLSAKGRQKKENWLTTWGYSGKASWSREQVTWVFVRELASWLGRELCSLYTRQMGNHRQKQGNGKEFTACSIFIEAKISQQ